MLVATVKLSSGGQIVIPKEVCDDLHWQAGTELVLIATKAARATNLTPLVNVLSISD